MPATLQALARQNARAPSRLRGNDLLRRCAEDVGCADAGRYQFSWNRYTAEIHDACAMMPLFFAGCRTAAISAKLAQAGARALLRSLGVIAQAFDCGIPPNGIISLRERGRHIKTFRVWIICMGWWAAQSEPPIMMRVIHNYREDIDMKLMSIKLAQMSASIYRRRPGFRYYFAPQWPHDSFAPRW